MSSTPSPSSSAAQLLSPADALVVVSQTGAVRQLSLNRPSALNSFTVEMHKALSSALDAAAEDAGVRCLVITGSGRGFCAGQDLNEPGMAPVPGETPDIAAVVERHYVPLALRLQSMPIPVIAAVNGVAAGAGANFALNCDLVVAARSASFIQAFSKIGLIPDCGGTWLLPRLVGRARALGLAMLGDKLSADDAQKIGLIWQVVDDGELANAVETLAQRLAAMPVSALAEIRRSIDAGQQLDYEAALRNEAAVQGRLGRQADFSEGVAAFQAKRPPVFRDR
ncbi:enoyl-CoA hydratase-related protein [Piscinibacter sakaiensis]|uniref:enoyl-CoA hydratase-related protein n=1 Tax=Piscinibacter sakaiensis TaxID=1547922 RepID=UPI003AB0D448